LFYIEIDGKCTDVQTRCLILTARCVLGTSKRPRIRIVSYPDTRSLDLVSEICNGFPSRCRWM